MLRLLLGPQRLVTTLGDELDRLPFKGKIAAITAGWQEREEEDEELQAVVGNRAVNLRLHARIDQVFQHDRELFFAHRRKQDVLRRLQDLYRLRLDALASAARSLAELDEEPELVEPELEQALGSLRDLDAHHIARVAEVDAEFAHTMGVLDRPGLARHRSEICSILDACELVAIAGGHVATIVNRLRILGLDTAISAKAVVAWSAGAMAITDRVILFHDNPADGRREAEVLGPGLGLLPAVVALPHARRRLELTNPLRVGLFARRFAPAVCVALDERCRVELDQGRLTANEHTRWLAPDGHVKPCCGPQHMHSARPTAWQGGTR